MLDGPNLEPNHIPVGVGDMAKPALPLERLESLRDLLVAAHDAAPSTFNYAATSNGYRLHLQPKRGTDNHTASFGQAALSPLFSANVVRYSVGPGALAGAQSPGTTSPSDGQPPSLTQYRQAFETADRDIDLFNMLVLPRSSDIISTPAPIDSFWSEASAFCARRRAVLLADAPTNWGGPQAAANQVVNARSGIVADHTAVYYPDILIREGSVERALGPSGAVAGAAARTDAERGVWKTPAGTEVELRGVRGVTRNLSDADNGTLNPRALNCIRRFPQGTLVWGGRTMAGDDADGHEYRYLSVRRLALYLEESLFRALRWVVFEPNGEALWAQIRLNVGSFMDDLFRQGAFAGKTPSQAFFVRCDGETTSPIDRDRGIVNVAVGFAPLKPAEFVILQIQQVIEPN